MCARDEACNVEEFDGDGAGALLAGAVVGFAPLLQRRRFTGLWSVAGE